MLNAFQVTGIVTLFMMILSTINPSFFLSLGRVLFFSLIFLIVAQLISVFFFPSALSMIDYIAALIFCGYIGFDWARANQIPKTLDNAVDSAASLYIDIANLFLIILRILSGRR